MSSTPAAEEIDEAKERAHFRAVVTAFKYYKLCSLDRIHKSEKIISILPPTHQRRLGKYKTYLTKFKKCLDVNNSIVHMIIKDVDTMFENVDHSVDSTNGTESFGCNYNNCEIASQKQHKMQHDVEKVQSVLKNIVRDWSDMGAPERQQCYKPILDEIDERFPEEDIGDRSHIKVLVPGAGLGRLAWEIAGRGFTCQGNEFSLFMLFASNFILNRCGEVVAFTWMGDRSHIKVLVPGAGLGRLAWEIAGRSFTCQGNEFSLIMLFASNFILNRCGEKNQYTVHPWVHQHVNNLTCEHQLLAAHFPDVTPSGDRPNHNFSMTAGDFLKVYTEPDEWHCLATCFFIDCAPNVIEFIERIYSILQPGGYWINLGPLLYHYSDTPTENSIEPPYDILLDIIKDIGFDILREQTGVKTKYAQNPNSMMQHEYDSVFFVCRKPYCI